MRILLVEDNADSRTYLERALKALGYTIDSASNGVDGLQRAKDVVPDLIVSDILMPQMDGFEFCRRVKTDEGLRAIPFVFYTATYVEPKDEKLAMTLGASRFLIKPMELDDFVCAIKAVLDEHDDQSLETPQRPLATCEDLDHMQLEAVVRKLDKKARDLEEEREALRRSDAELREARAAAEAATRVKSQFLANMSHELRTPIAGVLGMLELVLHGPLELEQRECIKIAQRSAGSLVGILADILEITEIEAGAVFLVEKPFLLRECMRNVIELYEAEARHKGLGLILTLADDLPGKVVGDSLRLRQVLTNLVGNAIKFTVRGEAELTVTAGENLSAEQREFTFTVKDTGIGISEEKRDLIFASFTQEDDSDTRRYGGAGLGLAISKEVVKRLGGNLTVSSTHRGGCAFTFTVPLKVPYELQSVD